MTGLPCCRAFVTIIPSRPVFSQLRSRLMAAPKKKQERFQWSRDVSRVQVLGHGKLVRVFDHEGKAHQIPARPAFIGGVLDAIYAEDPECAERVINELAAAGLGVDWVPSSPDE